MADAMRRAIKLIRSFANYVTRPNNHTYYPECKQKCLVRICLENLWWLIRYQEIGWSYYLYGLDRVGSRPQEYLAENVFNKISIGLNNRSQVGRHVTSYGALVKDKFLFYEYVASLGYPVVPTMGLIFRDHISWLGGTRQDTLQSIARREGLDAFVKEVLEQGGHGLYRLQVQNGEIFWNGSPIRPGDIEHRIQGPCVLQERINQHAALNKICPFSVCTLRVITMVANGGVEVLACAFRVGTKHTQGDNWSTGGLSIGVNEEGVLGQYGFYQPRFGRKTDHHPETHCTFEGFKLPYYDQAIAMVLDLHRFFYGLHSIGWDIVITNEGPWLMEANENWGLRLVHVHTPSLKDRYLASLPRKLFEV